MRTMKYGIVTLLTALIGACSSVYVPEPLGDEAVPLDPAEWQGTWISGEYVLMTTVLDAAAGRLEAAWLERGDDGARTERFEGVVRRTGDWLFLSMIHQPAAGVDDGENSTDAPRPPDYLWARTTSNGDRALIWWPDPEAFRGAVESGELPGELDAEDNIHLGALTPDQLARINDPGAGLLMWHDPLVLVRIGD